ncbi:DUF3822 family protein [Pontibacter silvestris]|uniref:DUF3822 family protein n=1 Tax=Pontibacter silvestris TaxID=2305183 RepID=A0ABW4WWI9_9BACT|nr:DUF3822 family protein [Pontibacter silvestris]MCC9136898.1 DUF3822 family protein [Pontibacter silvestris]
MNTTSTHFRLSHKIKDEAFKITQSSYCNLYLTISPRSIRIAVVNTDRNKFVVLEDYELLSVFTPQQIAEQLQLITAENPLLQEQGWNAIRVSYSNQHFTLIPETLYDPTHKTDYLRLHSDLNMQENLVFSYRHNNLEAVNIFAIDMILQQTVDNIFPERPVQLVHLTSALIQSVLHQAGRKNERCLYAYVQRNYVTMLVVSQSGLEFCNIFHYLSPEDFIYFVVFVMQEQKLNPETETITVWGDITHDSSLFNILQKYIRQVRFGRKPADVAYSYKFDDLFEYRYFELYSLHFCE